MSEASQCAGREAHRPKTEIQFIPKNMYSTQAHLGRKTEISPTMSRCRKRQLKSFALTAPFAPQHQELLVKNGRTANGTSAD